MQELQELQELQEVQGATLTSGPGADTGRGPLLALGGVQQQPCAVSMCTLRNRGGPQANTKCLHIFADIAGKVFKNVSRIIVSTKVFSAA